MGDNERFYTPPEMLVSTKHAGSPAKLVSFMLGVVLFEAVFLQVPFKKAVSHDIYYSHFFSK